MYSIPMDTANDERTLVVKNFDPDQMTPRLLKELCIQAGPVRNVVIKPDHAFVEYEDIESVGYSKALLDGIIMFGKKLILEPKTKTPIYFKDTQLLRDYIQYDKQNKAIQQQQQTMMMLAGQQTQAHGFVQPQAHVVPYPSSNPDPTIFNYLPQSSINRQDSFAIHSRGRPSTSSYVTHNNNSNRRRPRNHRR